MTLQKTTQGWRSLIDIKLAISCLAAFTAMFFWGSPAVDSVGALLVLLSLIGGANSVLSLALCAAVRFLNPALIAPSEHINAISWLILAVGFFRNFSYFFSKKYIIDIWSVWLLTLWALISSLIASQYLVVSLLKITSFFIGVTMIISTMRGISNKSYAAFGRQITTIYLVFITTSFPLIFISNIGFFLNQSGFQGIFNQPQSFAIYITPALAYLLAKLFERKSINIFYLLVTTLSLVMLFESKARTAVLAISISIFMAMIIALIKKSKLKTKVNTFKVAVVPIVTAAIFCSAFSYSPSFRDGIYGFVFKHFEKSSVNSAFYESRGGLLEKQLKNFEESPIWGNGFGVYGGQIKAKNEAVFMGIPLSAPVEKGFILTAVLEEMGAVGEAIFLLTIIHLVFRASRVESASLLAAFLGCIFVNFGESVFFSLGGIGIHFWILISYILGGATRTKGPTNLQQSEGLPSMASNI